MARIVGSLSVVLGFVLFTVVSTPLSAAQGAGTAAPAGAPPEARAVGTVHDIMVAMVMPSSDIVFNAGADEPKTDADWEKLRLAAIELAESANLLMIGSRVRDRSDWLAMAGAQRDAAETVVRLAAEKKVDGLADASDKAYETCTTCHNKYWADRNTPR
jgi:hypothetical protein